MGNMIQQRPQSVGSRYVIGQNINQHGQQFIGEVRVGQSLNSAFVWKVHGGDMTIEGRDNKWSTPLGNDDIKVLRCEKVVDFDVKVSIPRAHFRLYTNYTGEFSVAIDTEQVPKWNGTRFEIKVDDALGNSLLQNGSSYDTMYGKHSTLRTGLFMTTNALTDLTVTLSHKSDVVKEGLTIKSFTLK